MDFILVQKLFLFLRYFSFWHDFFGYVGNGVDKKAKGNSKIYDVSTWKQITTTHKLPKISRKIGSQVMKSVQVIEHNARNVFLQKPYRNEAGRLLQTSFYFLEILYMR